MRETIRFAICLMVLWPGVLLAEEAADGREAIGLPGFYGSSESGGFAAYKLGAGAYPRYEHGDRYTGVEYQKSYFSQGGWNSWADEYRVITKAINPRTGLGYNLNLGYNRENKFGLLTTDSQFGFGVTDSTRVELLLNRERVETQSAITSNVYYTFPAVSMEHELSARLSVVVMGGDMFFSDSNSRPTLRLSLIYGLLPDNGVSAQLHYRQYHDRNTNVPVTYFNPENYNEGMFALGIRRRVSGWMLNGLAGLGQQSINYQPGTTTQLLEAGATSPFAGQVFFRMRLGFRKSAGFQGPDYLYRYLMGELLFSH